MRITTLVPKRATLQFAGYPLELRKRPESYDYQRMSRDDAFQIHRGNYARYGDVTLLMKAPDDMYAVMASGDEVTADFDTAGLPLVQPDGTELCSCMPMAMKKRWKPTPRSPTRSLPCLSIT